MRKLSWRTLARLEDLAVLVVIVGLVVSVLLQVMSRYALGNYVSLAWTDEVARGLVAWLTFIGAVLLDRDGEHIAVTVVTDLLGERSRRLFGVLTDVFCAAFLILLLYSSIGSLRADAQSTMVSLPLPMTVVSSSLALGTALMLLHVGRRLAGRVGDLLRVPGG